MTTPTIAISGGSKGMGRAIAELFGQRGWRVIVAARGKKDLEQMQVNWPERFPHSQLLTLTTDLGTPTGCKAFIERVKDTVDHLDLFVNNLGMFRQGSVLQDPDNQLAAFFQVNVLAAHQLTQGLLPLLQATDRSHIITIGSVAVTDWPAGVNLYSISKWALFGWHKALRQELADSTVRVSLLTPGATLTSSWEGEEDIPAHILLPETIAQTVAHLWDQNEQMDTEEVIIRPS